MSTIQWVLVYSQAYTTITTIQIQNILITSERNPTPINSHSPSAFTHPGPQHPSIYLLSLYFPILDISHNMWVLWVKLPFIFLSF